MNLATPQYTAECTIYTYTKNVPLVLMLCIRSYRFISVCKVGVRDIALALLIKISIPPNCNNWKPCQLNAIRKLCHIMIIVQTVSTAFLTADLTADSSRTSKMQGKALPPAFSTVDINSYKLCSMKMALWFARVPLTLFSRRINCARQFWMWFSCFRRYNYVGTIASRF